MKTFKVLSALMAYPTADLQEAGAELSAALAEEGLLPQRREDELVEFIDHLVASDLLVLQAEYVGLFDRGRNLSLHLFEHVHGESRDRGQAMIDLMGVYQRHGLELDSRELPDYLPMFLEFIASLEIAEARETLAEALHVVSLIGARLAERGSRYHVLFDALEAIAGADAEAHEEIRAQVAGEGPDSTITDMDKIWEEEQVSFLGNPATCGASEPAAQQTVQFVRQPVSGQAPAPL